MAITPNDILSKTFERSFRGYDEDQVDEFLDVLKEEIERINEENHLLMGQIMSLEEEIHTLREKSETEPSASVAPEPTEQDERAKAGIETAKATATRIIAEAKETAEHIIQASNKKAAEMMTRIEAERKKVSATEVIASTADSGVDTAAVQKEAAELMERAKRNASVLMARAKTEAETQASVILNEARQKAATEESKMNSQLTDAKSQLESIQNAVKAYKEKLESFINSQAQAFQGFDPNVKGFDPKDLNTPQVNATQAPIEPPKEAPVPKAVEPEEVMPKYQPYQPTDTDKAYADDLKFSGNLYTKPLEKPVISEVVEPKIEEPKKQSSIIFNESDIAGIKPVVEDQNKTEPEPQATKKPGLTDEQSDERYRQVLDQIRSIEKDKGVVKPAEPSSAPKSFESVNPVKDMTDQVKKVEHKPSASSVIISDDDDFVGKISAAEPVEWDEPVPMSDEEKRHLREMLDDML